MQLEPKLHILFIGSPRNEEYHQEMQPVHKSAFWSKLWQYTAKTQNGRNVRKEQHSAETY